MNINEVKSIVDKALDKQNPIKARLNDLYGIQCPVCLAIAFEKDIPQWMTEGYCWHCGQKLDWSEKNGL